MTPLHPLPIRRRIYGLEGLRTYSRRLATANSTSVDEIDLALRQTGQVTSSGLHHSTRLQAWRELGNLNARAFSFPAQISGNWVTERTFCVICCRGDHAFGKLPRVGMACLHHQRWLDEYQTPVGDFHDALTAERRYRNRLAGRGVFFDSYAMLAGLEYALLLVSADQKVTRAGRTGTNDPALLVYPERVQFARLLSTRSFLNVLAEPDIEPRARKAEIERRIREIADSGEIWRVTNRVWTLGTRLSSVVAAARRGRDHPIDLQYNLLRLSSLSPTTTNY